MFDQIAAAMTTYAIWTLCPTSIEAGRYGQVSATILARARPQSRATSQHPWPAELYLLRYFTETAPTASSDGTQPPSPLYFFLLHHIHGDKGLCQHSVPRWF
ncbi:hypothetical protein BV20DRAFT_648163 [Pilatotrama ljubarskyi]|nr:hypothetical protein BV20DRAFT_648163 [Pilatotrama ljubarskyi]